MEEVSREVSERKPLRGYLEREKIIEKIVGAQRIGKDYRDRKSSVIIRRDFN